MFVQFLHSRAPTRRFVPTRARSCARAAAARGRVGGGALVPERGVRRARRAWLAGAEVRGHGGDCVADAVLRRGARALRLGRAWRPGSARTCSIATPPICRFGTDEQKARWLAPADRAASGSARWRSPSRTRARTSRRIRTRAVRVDGGWLVNGAKTFITNGVRADFFVTAVKTTAEGGHGGLSFLVVERGEGVAPRRSRSSAGTPPTPPSSRSTTSSCPRSTCSARRTAAST